MGIPYQYLASACVSIKTTKSANKVTNELFTVAVRQIWTGL